MTLNSKDLKEVIKLIVSDNIELGKLGEFTTSIGVEGEAGIGKTSMIRQVVVEMGMPFIKLSLAQNTVEDIIGFPIVEMEMCKGEECHWVQKVAIQQFVDNGWSLSGNTRTSYAVPKWLAPYVGTSTPLVLCLDDFSRAPQGLIAACMEICEEQEYVSWKLPPGSTVITSSNPDTADYILTSVDSAVETRKLTYGMKFHLETWIDEFAIPNGINDKFIDFMRIHGSEVIATEVTHDVNGNKLKRSNIRIWTKYFKVVNAVKDWYDRMDLVIALAGINFPPEHINLFSAFLRKLFERVPTNEAVMDLKRQMKEVGEEVQLAINIPSGGIRADISSLFYNRFLSHVLLHGDSFNDKQTARVVEIIVHGIDSGCLHLDLFMVILKRLTANIKIVTEVTKHERVRAVFANA